MLFLGCRVHISAQLDGEARAETALLVLSKALLQDHCWVDASWSGFKGGCLWLWCGKCQKTVGFLKSQSALLTFLCNQKKMWQQLVFCFCFFLLLSICGYLNPDYCFKCKGKKYTYHEPLCLLWKLDLKERQLFKLNSKLKKCELGNAVCWSGAGASCTDVIILNVVV